MKILYTYLTRWNLRKADKIFVRMKRRRECEKGKKICLFKIIVHFILIISSVAKSKFIIIAISHLLCSRTKRIDFVGLFHSYAVITDSNLMWWSLPLAPIFKSVRIFFSHWARTLSIDHLCFELNETDRDNNQLFWWTGE